ncbi:MAG TPA: FAD binding domain-containing protein, partial [Exilispira sp.]|nr:FAD binding domain-containing protein [Exilispira sp.]
MYSSFEYFKPKTMSEVVSLIKMLEGEADFLAGGTDLLLSIKRGEKKPSALVDISGLSELHNLYIKDGKLHIGSMTTFATLAISPVVEKYAIALKMAALEM